MRDFIEKAFFRVFINGVSTDMEIALGTITIGASSGALVLGVNSILYYLLWGSIVVCFVSVLSAFPFNNLKLRHYSNYLSTLLSLIIAFVIMNVGGDITGIGGYAFLSIWSYYCAFKTKLEIENNKRE